MIKIILLFTFLIFFQLPMFAFNECFVAMENNKILKIKGNCTTPFPPQSTFKIALSLMGFDSSILKDENNPSWSLPIDKDPYINICKDDHDPKTWMRDSCLWYSQILTTKLGKEKLQEYVNQFVYGNRDLSGGLTNSWVSSSLKISAMEQIEFLQKMIDKKFPISQKSYEETKKIMFIQEMAGGWKLYAKTGYGKYLDIDGVKTYSPHDWFVGYIEKGNRQIVFADHVRESRLQKSFASFQARNQALTKLWYIINQL